jgi:hypothetical protein
MPGPLLFWSLRGSADAEFDTSDAPPFPDFSFLVARLRQNLDLASTARAV